MSVLGHCVSLACDLLDVMSRTSAVPDAAGIAAIVAKVKKRPACVCDRSSPLIANISLDLADLLCTKKGVGGLSRCAHPYHSLVVVHTAKTRWFILPVASARNSAVFAMPVIPSGKLKTFNIPPLARISVTGT